MKTNHSLKFLQSTVAAMLAIVVACVISIRPAQAGYVVTLDQVGANVVATGTGPLDLTGLGSPSNPSGPAGINPSIGVIRTGPAASITLDVFASVNISGPTSFGNSGPFFIDASSGNGDMVGIEGTNHNLEVPFNYVSNNPLSDTATYNNATFASLGVTPGTYEWTWGTGANQNFTLQIGPATVPDTGSTLGLLALALAGLFGTRRLRPIRAA